MYVTTSGDDKSKQKKKEKERKAHTELHDGLHGFCSFPCAKYRHSMHATTTPCAIGCGKSKSAGEEVAVADRKKKKASMSIHPTSVSHGGKGPVSWDALHGAPSDRAEGRPTFERHSCPGSVLAARPRRASSGAGQDRGGGHKTSQKKKKKKKEGR